MMASTVTVEPQTGTDGYGKPTYGAASTYRAHLSRKRQLFRSGNGQEVASEQVLYLGTADDVQPTSRLTLSTGDVTSTESYAIHPTIRGVERRFAESGPHHVVLFL